MIRVVCIDENEGTQNNMPKLLTNGKIYDAYTSEDFNPLHAGHHTPDDCYYIISDDGYSIMPLIGIRKEIQNKDLQIISLKGLPIKTDWSLIWVKGKNHNPAALAYLDYLKKEKEAIIHSKFSWYETM